MTAGTKLIFGFSSALAALVGAGILLIESRRSPVAPATFAGRAPIVALLWTRSFRPDALEYISAKKLRRNHRVETGDLIPSPTLDAALVDWLPPKSERVNKYLRKASQVGDPIRLEDLSGEPLSGPMENSILVQVRLPIRDDPAKQAAALKALKAGDEVTIQKAAPEAVPESKLKGTFISSADEEK